MRHVCVRVSHILVSVMFLSLIASGQDFLKAEVFGGYSYLHVDTQGITTSTLNNQCNISFGGTCPITFGIHSGFKEHCAPGQFESLVWNQGSDFRAVWQYS
jgi:hypothetical protein